MHEDFFADRRDGAKIAIFDQYMALASMNVEVSSVVNISSVE